MTENSPNERAEGSQASTFDWYRNGMSLLESGNPEAAAEVLRRLVTAEPSSASAWEAYGRALFDARRYGEAVVAFTVLVEREPDNHYGHFGLGLALWRQQQFPQARDHLAMAFVMRPQRPEYGQALSQVKATLQARADAGLPLEGPVPGVSDSDSDPEGRP